MKRQAIFLQKSSLSLFYELSYKTLRFLQITKYVTYNSSFYNIYSYKTQNLLRRITSKDKNSLFQTQIIRFSARSSITNLARRVQLENRKNRRIGESCHQCKENLTPIFTDLCPSVLTFISLVCRISDDNLHDLSQVYSKSSREQQRIVWSCGDLFVLFVGARQLARLQNLLSYVRTGPCLLYEAEDRLFFSSSPR